MLSKDMKIPTINKSEANKINDENKNSHLMHGLIYLTKQNY